MTEAQTLLLVLVVIYLLECSGMARRGAVLFRSVLLGPCRIRSTDELHGGARVGFFLTAPLPPLGRLFLCQWWPLSLTPSAVIVPGASSFNPGASPRPPARSVAYAEIGSVEARDDVVMINGAPFAQACSAKMADHLAGLIATLRARPEHERETLILSALEAGFDAGTAGARVADASRLTVLLRLLCNVLFVHLLVVSPLAIWLAGWRVSWPWLLAGLALLVAGIALETARAHRRFFPEARGDRAQAIFMVCISPLGAIRAATTLTRDLLWEHHPLAAAQALCAPGLAEEFARLVLLDARHPFGGAAQADAWFRQRVIACAEQAVKAAGLDPAALTAPPRSHDEKCRTYCPRCDVQYARDAGSCDDCGGLPLIKLA